MVTAEQAAQWDREVRAMRTQLRRRCRPMSRRWWGFVLDAALESFLFRIPWRIVGPLTFWGVAAAAIVSGLFALGVL